MEESERKSVRAKSEGTPAPTSTARSVPEQEPEEESKAAHDEADQIDVCSDKFDPLMALYSPTVSIPFPKIKCFNNVSEYESFLKGGRGRAKPENVEKKRLKAMKGVADPERIERLKRLMVNNPVAESEGGESSSAPQRRRQKVQKNVLTRMPLCEGSPLGELYRCVQERIRVKVHIRTFKGLRGVCSGFVVAFDKFWNMAMVDVDETYREPLLGEAFYHEKALTISRLFEKLKLQESPAGSQPTAKPDEGETVRSHLPVQDPGRREQSSTGAGLSHGLGTKYKDSPKAREENNATKPGKCHTRHINQLFIRGENVILVNPQRL
eukprot:XP_003970578.1 PREDICTED: U7 snRNA-associated Sm-like protein LSm11 [Takifugu rubripes]